MAPDCPRVGKWRRACAFVDHYDETQVAPDCEKIKVIVDAAWSDDMAEIIRQATAVNKTYVCSVCVTCGRTVSRPEAARGT